MRAPSSDASEDDGANEDLDYSEFFSVLMYYGHMSKKEIMNSSRPFLYAIYKKYAKRACENLGVSPDVEDTENDEESNDIDNGYPTSFGKISDLDRQETMDQLTRNEDFMRRFGNKLNS